MLTGQELGKAIRTALEQNGKTPADAARHFKIKPPSISGWMSTGRISKENFNQLVHWLDKTPLSHWGLVDYRVSNQTVMERKFASHAKKLGLNVERIDSTKIDLVPDQVRQLFGEGTNYIPDFLVTYPDGRRVFVDVNNPARLSFQNERSMLNLQKIRPDLYRVVGLTSDQFDQGIDVFMNSLVGGDDSSLAQPTSRSTTQEDPAIDFVDPRDQPQGSNEFEYAFEGLQILLARVGPLLKKTARATLHDWIDGISSTAETTATLKALVEASKNDPNVSHQSGQLFADRIKANG